MKLLVDANLSPRIAVLLSDSGYDASHVQDHGLLTASDETILRCALDTGQVIVSADSDFATMLALAGMSSPSLILLRSADRLSPDEQAGLLIANLPTTVHDLKAGCVVSISRNHLRVRPLPIQR